MSRTKMMQRFAGVAAMALAANAFAQIELYQQDFEALDILDPDALADDGWVVGANVFDGAGNFVYNYFAFPAPNPGAGFSAIDMGQGGPDQGMQQLSIYNDYNNGDHGNPDRVLEANVFNESVVAMSDVGNTYTFSFDVKAGNIAASDNNSTAVAFVKVLNPATGFSASRLELVDVTDIPETWQGIRISTAITEDLVGQIFQIGFWSLGGGFEDSGVFYDNLLVEVNNDNPVFTSATAESSTLAGLPTKVTAEVTDPNDDLVALEVYVGATLLATLPNPVNGMNEIVIPGSATAMLETNEGARYRVRAVDAAGNVADYRALSEGVCVADVDGDGMPRTAMDLMGVIEALTN